MTNVALIDAEGVVINVIEAPGQDDDWSPPAGVSVWTQEPIPQRGWRLIGGEFVPPPELPTDSRVLMPVSFWMLRLTVPEIATFNLLRKKTQALVEADYASTDQAIQALIAWEAFLTHFDRLTTEIDLGHPLVRQGIELFAMLASLSAERVDELLAPPSQ